MKKVHKPASIPRMNALIILFALSIIAILHIIYVLLNRSPGVDLYATSVVLFSIVIALLEHAHVKVLKSARSILGILKGDKK